MLDDFKKYISTDYILLSANTTVEQAYSKIYRVNPEFVILYRVDPRVSQKKLLYYTFLVELLLDFKEQNPNRGNPDDLLIDFLELHEYDADKTIEISGLIPAANDPTIDDLFQNNKNNPELIPLSSGNSIVGVFDAKRQNADSLYTMKLFNHSVKRKFPPPGTPTKGNLPQGVKSKGVTRGLSSDPQLRGDPFIAKGPTLDPEDTDDAPPKPYVAANKTENPTKVGKFVSTKMRKKMKIGTEESFFVELKEEKPPDEELPKGNFTVDLSFPAEVTEVELLVSAMSSDPEIAEIRGPKDQKMIVQKNGDSSIVEFKIMPKKEGKFNIITIISYQSKTLGLFNTHSKVGHEISNSLSSSNGVVNPDITTPGPDLTMIIETITVNPFSFQIKLSSHKLGIGYKRMNPPVNCINAEEFFRATFATIEQINNSYKYSDKENNKKMSKIGIDLYNRLFPDEFKTWYWENKDNITTIQILSSEPWIPWEIIKPDREENDGDESKYLCEAHTITRWLFDLDFVHKPTIKSIKVVQPEDTNLEGAKEEADFLEYFWENDLNSKESWEELSTLKDVTNSLEKGDFDILHCTTHGAYNPDLATQSELVLENGQVLTPIDLSGGDIKIGKNNPLVILNACQTGNTGFVLTGIGGWSEAFLRKKASAFMGTLWSISDNTALFFTKSLYKHLKDNKSLDVAVKLARLEAKANTNGDPSWLAYSLYSQSNAKFELEIGGN